MEPAKKGAESEAKPIQRKTFSWQIGAFSVLTNVQHFHQLATKDSYNQYASETVDWNNTHRSTLSTAQTILASFVFPIVTHNANPRWDIQVTFVLSPLGTEEIWSGRQGKRTGTGFHKTKVNITARACTTQESRVCESISVVMSVLLSAKVNQRQRLWLFIQCHWATLGTNMKAAGIEVQPANISRNWVPCRFTAKREVAWEKFPDEIFFHDIDVFAGGRGDRGREVKFCWFKQEQD